MTQREAFEAVAAKEYPPGRIEWVGLTPAKYPGNGEAGIPLTMEWFYWQASAARYEGVVEALRPFAALADLADKYKHEDNSTCEWRLKASDLRRARQALAALDGAK